MSKQDKQPPQGGISEHMELDSEQRAQKVAELETEARRLRTAPAKLKKLAQPGHKEPEAHPYDGRIRIWEPEAYNAHLTAAQAARGAERNLDCPPGLNKTHTITDKPVVQKEWRAQAQRKGPVPGADASAEPFNG